MPFKQRKINPRGLRGMAEIRESVQALLSDFNNHTEPSREQSLAITNLEQAIFWVNKAISKQHEMKED